MASSGGALEALSFLNDTILPQEDQADKRLFFCGLRPALPNAGPAGRMWKGRPPGRPGVDAKALPSAAGAGKLSFLKKRTAWAL
jgi:hypothetical protein